MTRDFIILNNDVVENRIRKDVELHEFYYLHLQDVSSYVYVGRNCAPLWTESEEDLSHWHALLNRQVALCEVQSFSTNESKYFRLLESTMKQWRSQNCKDCAIHNQLLVIHR